MKNLSLKKDSKVIAERAKELIIKKTELTDNSVIEVYVESPFEDIGTYVYYNRTDERDSDFKELQNLIAESNEKAL
jgi:hypothetical protein